MTGSQGCQYLHPAASLRTLRCFNSLDAFVSVITKAIGCTFAETRTFSTNGCAVWNALQCSIGLHHPILSVSTPTINMGSRIKDVHKKRPLFLLLPRVLSAGVRSWSTLLPPFRTSAFSITHCSMV